MKRSRPMSKAYRPYEPDQQMPLPPALKEWLPTDHLAYLVSDVVDGRVVRRPPAMAYGPR